MLKTSVYLSDEEAAGLRRLATTTGRSQAELIREGVRRLMLDEPPRRFRSRGLGSGPPYAPPSVDEIEARVHGR